MHKRYGIRLPLISLAVVSLLGALWGGLLRSGWTWPMLHGSLPMAHGPLMVSGFLGTLVSLERAVALNRRWTYLAPLCSGAGSLLLLRGGPSWAGPLLMLIGSFVLAAIFVVIIHQQPALFTATMGLGALGWPIGNILWLLGRPIPDVVLWWAGFLILTIVGERLELSRVLRRTRLQYGVLAGALGLFIGGVLLSLWDSDSGIRVSGGGMLALALWLLRYDIVRRMIRRTGLPRFIALALLVGFIWLGVGGLLAIRFGGVTGGLYYDALLHAIFVGFVISMVFGHAPIIFPSVLQLPLHYDRWVYLPLVLLHSSLLVRIGGDLGGIPSLRRYGSLLNAVALLLFLGNTLRLIHSSMRASRNR